MSQAPKLGQVRAWGESSLPANGNKARSGSAGGGFVEDRRADVRRVAFFVGVALVVVLVNHLWSRKDISEDNPNTLPTLVMTVSSPAERQPGDRAGSQMVFRLGNMGKHSLFYAVNKETNAPFGEIVSRTSVSSKWITPSGLSEDQNTASNELRGRAVTWIEMPPEGWVDGEFQDAKDFPSEHAYTVFVKPSQEGKVFRVFSNSYRAEGK